MRNIKQYGSHKTNPFEDPQERRSVCVYHPDEYTLNIIAALSPKALRVLLVMATRLDPLTGLCLCPTKDLIKLVGGFPSGISKAKMELVRMGLIAYGKANYTFYLSPKAFKPVHITM